MVQRDPAALAPRAALCPHFALEPGAQPRTCRGILPPGTCIAAGRKGGPRDQRRGWRQEKLERTGKLLFHVGGVLQRGHACPGSAVDTVLGPRHRPHKAEPRTLDGHTPPCIFQVTPIVKSPRRHAWPSPGSPDRRPLPVTHPLLWNMPIWVERAYGPRIWGPNL